MSSRDKIFDFAIVGGGIIGAATFYTLQKKNTKLRLLLLEKEASLAQHQSGRNSGVIHSGLYYKPGSMKALTCLKGRELLIKFTKKHKVVHKICGKVIVATDKSQLDRLRHLYANGKANLIKGLYMLSAAELREVEPHCQGEGALLVQSAGIINFGAVTQMLVEQTLRINSDSAIKLETEVHRWSRSETCTTLYSLSRSFQANKVIFCGGLHSDRLARKDNLKLNMVVVPFRGDYYELTEEARTLVRNMIYPIGDRKFPFLGVHLTRMIDGSVECGPNAVFSFKREGYSPRAFSLRDTIGSLTHLGTLRFMARHWHYGVGEYRRTFSKRLFLKTLQKLVPDLKLADLVPARSAIRAQAMSDDGSLVDDFRIERHGNHLHVLNAPSPAATAALAIAQEIVSRLYE